MVESLGILIGDSVAALLPPLRAGVVAGGVACWATSGKAAAATRAVARSRIEIGMGIRVNVGIPERIAAGGRRAMVRPASGARPAGGWGVPHPPLDLCLRQADSIGFWPRRPSSVHSDGRPGPIIRFDGRHWSIRMGDRGTPRSLRTDFELPGEAL